MADRGDVGRAAHRCHQHHSVHLDAPHRCGPAVPKEFRPHRTPEVRQWWQGDGR
jgi:hypothetical protein